MTANKVKAWVLAALKANSGVIAIVSADQIQTWGQDWPSSVGLYVQIATDAKGEIPFDVVQVHIRVVQIGEAQCYALADAVERCLLHRPGRYKVWSSDPALFALAVKSVERVGIVDPVDAQGVGDTTFVCTYGVRITARDKTLPT